MVLEKDKFVEIIKNLAAIERGYSKMSEALELVGECWNVGMSKSTVIILDMLYYLFKDEDGIIDNYYCCMNEYGYCSENNVIMIDGVAYKLSSPEDLYDLLNERMQK